MAELLKTGHLSELQELELRCNNIGDEGAKALATAISACQERHCTALRKLWLLGNKVRDETKEVIKGMLKHFADAQEGLGLLV